MKSQINPRFLAIAKKEAQEASSKQKSSAQQAKPAGQAGATAQSGGGYNQQAPQNYQPPANQAWQPAAPAPAPQPQTGGGSSGYQLKPYEKYFDKNDVNADDTTIGGGNEDGNV